MSNVVDDLLSNVFSAQLNLRRLSEEGPLGASNQFLLGSNAPALKLSSPGQHKTKSHPGSSQIDAWLLTIKEMFAVEFEKLPINATKLPASKARYPRLRASEVSSLLRLFEQAFVASAGTFND